LTQANYPAPPPYNGEVHAWTYDAIGNRLTNTVNGVPQTYTYLKNGPNPLNGQRFGRVPDCDQACKNLICTVSGWASAAAQNLHKRNRDPGPAW
jgi:hypothetical protein